MLHYATPRNIILGSQSPRRRELMAGLDISFSCVTIDADESYPADLKAGDIPMYISRAKARAYTSELRENDLLITSDTIVWLNGEMLGKPQDEADAKAMLSRLSGQTHEVYTAVCFTWLDNTTQPLHHTTPHYTILHHSFVDCTKVTFRDLTEQEIDYYLAHYRPLDKAGAYGVQEWIGYVGVTKMEGSYFNVMGFPISRVYETLRQLKALN